MGEYEGAERRISRSKNMTDHDLLIRIDESLSNFLDNFKAHKKSNEKDFGILFPRTSKIQKFMWLIAGAFMVVEFYFRFIK